MASASATRVSVSERPRPEHGVGDGVVEHGPVRADREPGDGELGEDGRDPARGAAGDQHERHPGRDEPVDDGGRPGGDPVVGVEQRAVDVRRDEPGCLHGSQRRRGRRVRNGLRRSPGRRRRPERAVSPAGGSHSRARGRVSRGARRGGKDHDHPGTDHFGRRPWPRPRAAYAEVRSPSHHLVAARDRGPLRSCAVPRRTRDARGAPELAWHTATSPEVEVRGAGWVRAGWTSRRSSRRPRPRGWPADVCSTWPPTASCWCSPPPGTARRRCWARSRRGSPAPSCGTGSTRRTATPPSWPGGSAARWARPAWRATAGRSTTSRPRSTPRAATCCSSSTTSTPSRARRPSTAWPG